MKKKLRRFAVTAGVTVAVIAPLAGTAAAVVVTTASRQGSLTQAGPLAEHGFPAWYRDSNGLRLEACTTLDDPLCSTLPDEVPNPDAPVSYPDNFPGEFFYQLAGAQMTLANGVDFGIGMDLEGAWAAEEVRDGDQMVFGRIRIRFDAVEGTRYRITHPYGVDELTADDRGVNMTEDIGTTPGAFGQAITSRVGPFLKWDPAVAPAAPAGYTGDPGVDHRVVGSPYGTNFVRVEQVDPASGAVIADLGSTDLFSVQGRYAANSGIDIDQATYTVGANGTGVIEVFASSEPGQSIEVTGNAQLGFRTTRLRGDNGRYYGRFPVTGSVPATGATIEVVNAGDRPVARKTRKLVDVVRVTDARYDADAGTLTVAAASSDADSTPPQLSVTGFGPITGPFTGVTAPPAAVTVTSSSGGSTTVPLTGSGQAFVPDLPVANAVAPAAAVAGQKVTLDGTGSTGAIDTYSWTQTSGPAVIVTGAATPTASFVATQAGTYTFRLAVSGPGGAGTPVTVSVTVTGAAPAVANAGADQTVIRGRTVTLDGSASTGAETYQWRQVSGPAVTLTGATGARPTFTYPSLTLPAAPGPNPTYVYTNDPVVLELTARNPSGASTSRVTVRPQAETFTGLTVRYRTGNNEWRISGTSNLLAGQRITAVLGGTPAGRVVGTPVTVDAAGAFSIRVTGPNPGTVRTISFVSSTGGQVLGFPVTVTN
ncbi:PKD domain-containing protein [Actinoplanes xinjiangensis]|uniref:PKD domain-containing protein n=1 Tax=Actinoplanes xinjiangensis TaxID=512350 RepID=UPI00343FC854